MLAEKRKYFFSFQMNVFDQVSKIGKPMEQGPVGVGMIAQP